MKDEDVYITTLHYMKDVEKDKKLTGCEKKELVIKRMTAWLIEHNLEELAEIIPSLIEFIIMLSYKKETLLKKTKGCYHFHCIS